MLFTDSRGETIPTFNLSIKRRGKELPAAKYMISTIACGLEPSRNLSHVVVRLQVGQAIGKVREGGWISSAYTFWPTRHMQQHWSNVASSCRLWKKPGSYWLRFADRGEPQVPLTQRKKCSKGQSRMKQLHININYYNYHVLKQVKICSRVFCLVSGSAVSINEPGFYCWTFDFDMVYLH